MNFAFTDEQAMIAETAKAFFDENATSERTRAAMDNDGVDRALWHSFCQELGLAGIALPEAHGGSGLGLVEFAILAEAAGAQVAALPMLGSLAMTAHGLAHGGSEAQKAAWLPKLATGAAIGATGLGAKVSATGDRLSGTVDFVAHGTAADLFLIGTDSGAWLVERDAAGLTITACTTLDQTRPFARLTLADTPAEPLGDAAAALRAAQEGGWICVAAEALGGAQATLDRTVGYAQERVQFGRQIGSFQAYKHRLADMMVEIEQARSAIYWAACAVDEASDEAPVALHSAKSFAADTYFRCAGDMIQLHGGIGFTWGHDAHLFFKRARAIQSMLGTSAWHREQIARLIGLGDAA